MKSQERAKLCVKAIRLAWSSLDSHLDSSIKINKKESRYVGNERFHKKCVQEYADIIQILSKLMNG